MKVHIGKKIKERAEALRMKPTELAAKINTSKQNLYGIYKRQSIDSDLLHVISKALDFDFFTIYQQNIKKGIVNDPKTVYESNASLEKEVKLLKAKIADLDEKFDLLKSIVDLMKKKK